MKPVLLVLILWVLALGPARAQGPVVLDPREVLALAEAPWRDRATFRDALNDALDGVRIERAPLPDRLRDDDPWLWTLTGRFGAEVEGLQVPGGIVACSRYGLATRDRLAATALTDPAAFELFAATRAAADDASVWPDNAVARLACMITWDDTRRVAIIPERMAHAALTAVFDRIARRDDGDRPAGAMPIFGADGYRLEATGGLADSVAWLESARVELRLSHQAIRFRSFLMNGGM